MAKVLDWLSRVVAFLSEYFMITSFWEFIKAIIEVALIAVVIFKLIELVRDTRAWQLLKGVLILLLVAWSASLLGFNTISYILNNMFQLLAFALIVVFQDELRKILERLGNSNIKNIVFNDTQESVAVEKTINDIAGASCNMSKTNTGALIVIERDMRLGEIISTGININSEVSVELLEQIFVPNTPLHDGAVVIRDGKIMAASCLLPLTTNVNLSKELGTRHRAAIGITEISDSICVVVSEETGKISVTMDGKIRRGFDRDSLCKFLREVLVVEVKPKKRINFKRSNKA